MRELLTSCALVWLLCLPIVSSLAQEQEDDGIDSIVPSTAERLEFIQNALTQKLIDRRNLGERIEAANEQDKGDLRRQANDITTDIKQLRTTLESIAIGGIDVRLFVDEEVTDDGNWKEDIALIARPILDSLKDLTEKPRKLKSLNDTIALHQQELAVALQALDNVQPELAKSTNEDLQRSLRRITSIWRSRRDDAETSIELARFQIADLSGDKPLIPTIWNSLKEFMGGRGLTIAMAIGAALSVWLGLRFLLSGYRRTFKNTNTERRTRYRLAAYSVHVLTFSLILVAVFIVFYERGDVLLLGLLILLMLGLALGIRHLLPQRIA